MRIGLFLQTTFSKKEAKRYIAQQRLYGSAPKFPLAGKLRIGRVRYMKYFLWQFISLKQFIMDRLETFSQSESVEHNEDKKLRGAQLGKLIEQSGFEMDQLTADMLKLILEKNDHLSHVEVVFISPEEEPDTGGFFHRVKVDEQTFVPTIFVVSENQEHMNRLKDARKSSAARVASMLGIDFSKLSPALLRQFIVAHELGHASDYVKNYETNPDYKGADAAEEWDLHYEANLLTMPVPSFDPVDLREELSRFDSLEDFLKVNPSLSKTINISEIKTKQDLINVQEIAYRTSAYESYADDFATDFLKNNAVELNITELIDPDQQQEAA